MKWITLKWVVAPDITRDRNRTLPVPRHDIICVAVRRKDGKRIQNMVFSWEDELINRLSLVIITSELKAIYE